MLKLNSKRNSLIIYLIILFPILFTFLDGINNEVFVSSTESIFAWEAWFYSSGFSMYLLGTKSYLSSDPSIFIRILNSLVDFRASSLFAEIELPQYYDNTAKINWSTFDSFGIRLDANRVFIDYVDHGMSIFNFISFKIFGPLIGAPYLFLYLLIFISISITYFLINNRIIVLELGFVIVCYFFASTIYLQYSNYFVSSPVTYRFIGIVGIFPLIYLFNLKNISKMNNFTLLFWTSIQVSILFIVLIAHSQSYWQIFAILLFLTAYKFLYIVKLKHFVALFGSIILLVSLIAIFTSTVPASPNQVKTRLIWHSVFLGLNALPERQINGIALGRERGVYEDWNAFKVGYRNIPEVDSWKYIFSNTRDYENLLRSTVFEIIQNNPLILFKAFVFKLIQFSNMFWNFVTDFVVKDIRTFFILFYSVLIFSISRLSLKVYFKEFYFFNISVVLSSTFVVTFITYPQISNTIQSISLLTTFTLFVFINLVFKFVGKNGS